MYVATLQGVDQKATVISDEGGRGGFGRGGSSVGVVSEGSTFIRSGGGRGGNREGGRDGKERYDSCVRGNV